MDNILNDLTCPITLELFDDPITVPCCGKAFSRLALVQHLETAYVKKCPSCNGDLTDFNALKCAKNVTLASLVDAFKEKNPFETIVQNGVITDEHKWSSVLTRLTDKQNNVLPIGELTIMLENSSFKVKPTL